MGNFANKNYMKKANLKKVLAYQLF